MVCCNLAGNQVTNLVKQYAEFGLPYPMVGFNLNTGDAWAMGEGNLSGTWPTVWYHTLDNPASKAFVASFTKKYGKPPENHAWIEYITLKMHGAGDQRDQVDRDRRADRLSRKGDAVRHPEGAQGAISAPGIISWCRRPIRSRSSRRAR